jgi:Ca-activated chloride channel family protein
MSNVFISPLALALAAAILPAILALYMLKLRREEQRVSSTMLWRMLVRDTEANRFWQKLRRNLLLFLQLLIALLLIFALARPFVKTQGINSKNLIVMIDRSASMGAVDMQPSRLEAAKEQALKLIDQLPDGGRATVMAFGGDLEVPAASTSDRRELRRAIEAIGLRLGGGSDMGQAISLAGALAAREPDSEIALLSDGQVTVPVSATLPGTIRYFPVGTGSNNQAIASLTLEASGPGAQALFVRVLNEGQETVTRRVVIETSFGGVDDFQLFNVYDLQLLAGQDQTVTAELSSEVRMARARLEGGDELPLDDRAWAVQASSDPIPVRLVTPGNVFLATALGLMPRVQVTAYLSNTTVFTDTAAFTILDGVTPEQLPSGNLLFINPLRSTDYFSITGSLSRPVPRPILGEDPILRHITLADISIFRAAHVENAPWAHTVLDSDQGALILSGEVDGRRIAVIGFDFHESDLPLNISFPLLVSNLVGYLAPGSGGESAQIPPGTPISIPVSDEASEVRVIYPDGSDELITPSGGVALVHATHQDGIYQIELLRDDVPVRTLRYVINPYTETEAHITPIQQLRIRPIVPQEGGQIVGRDEQQAGRSEWWRPLALIALLFLVLEWLVAHRGGIARLRRRFSTTSPVETSRRDVSTGVDQ